MVPKVQEPLRYSGHHTYLDERLVGHPLKGGRELKVYGVKGGVAGEGK